MNRQREKLIIFGHQGAPGYAPENTLLSFNEALIRGADWIELDVHRIADQLMVIHDYRLDRTTNGKGIIYQHSPETLRALDAGRGERIPFLNEVLDLIDRKAGINIELKSDGSAEPVMALINHYLQQKDWSLDHFMISSFNHLELKKVRKLNTQIKIGILMYGIPLDLDRIIDVLRPYSVNISIDFISPSIVELIHSHDLKAYVYTVNFPDDIRWMQELGVDGIFTDFPDRVRQVIKQ